MPAAWSCTSMMNPNTRRATRTNTASPTADPYGAYGAGALSPPKKAVLAAADKLAAKRTALPLSRRCHASKSEDVK